MRTLKELEAVLPQIGVIEWIGVRPKSRELQIPLTEVSVTEDSGLEGDHYSGRSGSKRQVTLLQYR